MYLATYLGTCVLACQKVKNQLDLAPGRMFISCECLYYSSPTVSPPHFPSCCTKRCCCTKQINYNCPLFFSTGNCLVVGMHIFLEPIINSVSVICVCMYSFVHSAMAIRRDGVKLTRCKHNRVCIGPHPAAIIELCQSGCNKRFPSVASSLICIATFLALWRATQRLSVCVLGGPPPYMYVNTYVWHCSCYS
jgi:hypothetical protein